MSTSNGEARDLLDSIHVALDMAPGEYAELAVPVLEWIDEAIEDANPSRLWMLKDALDGVKASLPKVQDEQEHVATYDDGETQYGVTTIKFLCSCGHPAGGADRDPAEARRYAEQAFEAHRKSVTA